MAQEGTQTSGLSSNAPGISANCVQDPNNVYTTNPNIPMPPVQLTLRLLMQSRDVGSIIGKGGSTISKFRSDSNAFINITDGGTERIVTITGPINAVLAAVNMICQKVEEGIRPAENCPGNPNQPPVSLRILVPACQCGPLIGKSGSKIKELRETTGTTVQVAGELLPNSTERAVTISGTSESLSECFRCIAGIMLENPVRGPTLPYRPRQHTTVPSAAAAAAGPLFGFPPQAFAVDPYSLPPQLLPMKHMVNDFSHLPSGGHVAPSSFDMCIPNEFVGCVIGRGGHKISEIRRQSGATIKIANTVAHCSERRITISGAPDSIATAQQLIQARLHSEVAKPMMQQSDLVSILSATPGVGPMPLLPKHDPMLPAMPMHSNIPIATGPDSVAAGQA